LRYTRDIREKVSIFQYRLRKEESMAGKTEYKNHRQKENVDRINLTTQKGKEEIIKAHAESRRESVNGFINRAIDETMERDQAASGTAGEAMRDKS